MDIPVIEEGTCEFIKNPDSIYSLKENSNNLNNKLFISVNYPEKTLDTEYASLYTDSDCKNLFQELKPKTKGFNNIYDFDVSTAQKLYLKSNLTNEYFFYYKYATDKDVDQIKITKKVLKVKCLENKDNKLKISFNCPYSQENNFNTKYTVFFSEGKKKYNVFKDGKIEGAKIIEGNKDKYETEVEIDSSKKGQFVYIVAESKDSNVNLRPRIIYKGQEVPEPENKSETIINAILIVLITITLIYKFNKKRKLALQKKESNASGNSSLI